MSRYRLQPTPEQEIALVEHCRHARYVWNLAVEQQQHWRRGFSPAPGNAAPCRQLTEVQAEHAWLRAGSVTVQQQALWGFHQAMANYFSGTHRRPTWRKAGVNEGFRQVAVKPQHVERLNRRHGRVWIPKAGWVRFRWTRQVPDDVKSFRVTRDRAGRWRLAFAVIPDPVPAPGTGEVVGVDRGVTVSAALSTGELLHTPGLWVKETERLRRLQRRLARAKRGPTRRKRVKAQIARLRARETDRRKDWVEQTSTSLAARFDLVRVEGLNVRGMTASARGTVEQPGRNVRQKTGLNRSILAQGWGLLLIRLVQKAPGRVEKINAVYTSQTCSACGYCAPDNRESCEVFRRQSCGYRAHADVNAASNIAAGPAVTAHGDLQTPVGSGTCEAAGSEPAPALLTA